MSKKNKKRKKVDFSILNQIDNNMNSTYRDLLEEIEEYQYELNQAELKAKKKAKKQLKNNKGYIYDNKYQFQARKKICKRMESTDFLNRVTNSFNDVGTVIITICRLVAALILSILSFEPIKMIISKSTLNKMNKVYNIAMNVGK